MYEYDDSPCLPGWVGFDKDMGATRTLAAGRCH